MPGQRGVPLPTSVVALSAAFGVLLVAVAYTAGRHGYANSRSADLVYWAGQAFIIVPVSVRLLSRRASTEVSTVAIIVILTVAEYLVKVCYSPLSFTYTDELSHWRTAENILLSGRLFTANGMLPISSQYPGLEEVTTAIVRISGLSLFVCGLIVAGVAHLLFVVTLYLLFRNVGRSRRLAGIAILVYSSNPSLPYFDSLFAYETLALAFFGVALVAAYRFSQALTRSDRAGWCAIAMVAITAAVVTHHVTSYLLAATLILLTVSSVLVKDRAGAARCALLAFWTVIVFASWLIFIAPQTVSYLWPPINGVWQSFQSMLNGGLAGGPATSTNTPRGQQAIATVAVLFLSSLLPVGWWQVWKARRGVGGSAWILALTFGSLTWYAIVAIRLGAADGSELSGRASAFVFVPSSFVAGLALRWLVNFVPWPRVNTFLGIGLAGVVLLMVDGTVNSWPPFWERLPGPHQVAGVERSIGPEEITIAEWTLTELGPSNRFAADFSNNAALDSYGDQTPVLSDAFLFLSSAYTPSIQRQAQLLGIHYVFADLRLTEHLPVSGAYWFDDPNAGRYRHPLPRIDMTKFDQAYGVARVFDAGDIVIYDLTGGR